MSKHGGTTALSVVFGVLALLVLVVPASSQAQVQKQAESGRRARPTGTRI